MTFEIAVPSVRILAEPPVAVVDKFVDKHGTRTAAEAYLKLLYTPQARRSPPSTSIAMCDPEIAACHADKLPPLPLFTVDEVFGGWKAAQAAHFADGGLSDQIYKPDK